MCVEVLRLAALAGGIGIAAGSLAALIWAVNRGNTLVCRVVGCPDVAWVEWGSVLGLVVGVLVLIALYQTT